jgi:hypothetical protein
MNTSLSRTRDHKQIAFYPSYENVHALLAEIHLYVFSQNGDLVESQAIRRDKVVIAVADDALRGAKIVIAPPFENATEQSISLGSTKGHHVFETDLCFETGRSNYVLPPVPEAVWRWWLVHSLWKNVRKA